MIIQHLGGKKMKKLLGILMGMFALFLIPMVSALDVDIVDVDVNGIDMDNNPTVYVERGESISIRVQIEADDNLTEDDEVAEDLRVRVSISGYEYDIIEDVSDIFNLDEGLTAVKTLNLEIPEDIDANEEYTLEVEIVGGEGPNTEEEFTLKIEAQRHSLNIQNVIFSPGLSIDANTPLFVEVRVENIGDKKEEDILVQVSIPALGISQSTYIDELASVEDDGEDLEDSESTNALFLDLSNAAAGTYTLEVTVEYNNGYSEETESYDLTITGGVNGIITTEDVIDVANKVKTIAQGESVVYKVDIANLGSSAKTYSVEVVGLDIWATSSVDPSFTLVQAGNTGEIYIYVSAKEDSTIGQHMFTVKVKEGSNVVKEINLEGNVTPKAVTPSAWGNVIKGLEVGFIVLLIILVILGIIIAITKMGRGSDEALTAGEGQTYY